MWAILDLMFLYGSSPVARHWLFWQYLISMMNATNPSGNVTDSDIYKRIIYVSIGLSAAITIKRTLMGNFVGKRVVGMCSRRIQLYGAPMRRLLMHFPSVNF
jgi:hypothetical protein